MKTITSDATSEQIFTIMGKLQERNYEKEEAFRFLQFDSQETRDRAMWLWDRAGQPESYSEAVSMGFTPGKFMENMGEMQIAMGEMLLELPGYVGNKIGAAPFLMAPEGPLKQQAEDAIWGMEAKIYQQFQQEFLAPDSPELTQFKSQLHQEYRRIDRDQSRILDLEMRIDQINQRERPFMYALSKEIPYFSSKQAVMNKIAEKPAEVVSDVIGVVGAVVTGGSVAMGAAAGRGLKVGTTANRIMGILDLADPASMPAAVGARAMGTMGRRAMVGPDAEATDTESIERAERFGRDIYNTPPSMHNPSQNMITDQTFRLHSPGGLGERARDEITGTYAAGVKGLDNIVEDMNERGVPTDAQAAGRIALQHLDETQVENKMMRSEEYRLLNEQGDTTFDAEFDLEGKLNAMIEELQGSGEITDPDNLAAVQIIQGLLNQARERGGNINEMSVQSLRDLRTYFGSRYKDQVYSTDANRPSKVGEGSVERRVYRDVSQILDEGIDDLSGRGRLEEGTAASIKKGDQMTRERAELESTRAGQLLYKARKNDNPMSLINTLVNNRDWTDKDYNDVFELLGEEGTEDIRVAMMQALIGESKLTNTFMDRAQTAQQLPEPRMLGNRIAQMEKGRPGHLEVLFGDEAAAQLRDVAKLMDSLSSVIADVKNSRTPNTLIKLQDQANMISGLVAGIGTAFNTVRGGMDATEMAYTAGAAAATWMATRGVFLWKAQPWMRKRMLVGLGTPEQQEAMNQAFEIGVQVARRRYMKTAEMVTRVRDSATTATDENTIR